MYEVAGRGKPHQLRSLTPRTPSVQPEPTPQGRRHWCRLTEKYCTRTAIPFQNVPLSPRYVPPPFSLVPSSFRLFLLLSFSLCLPPRARLPSRLLPRSQIFSLPPIRPAHPRPSLHRPIPNVVLPVPGQANNFSRRAPSFARTLRRFPGPMVSRAEFFPAILANFAMAYVSIGCLINDERRPRFV